MRFPLGDRPDAVARALAIKLLRQGEHAQPGRPAAGRRRASPKASPLAWLAPGRTVCPLMLVAFVKKVLNPDSFAQREVMFLAKGGQIPHCLPAPLLFHRRSCMERLQCTSHHFFRSSARFESPLVDGTSSATIRRYAT